MLGHSRIATTVDTYSHVLPSLQGETTLAFETALGQTQDGGFFKNGGKLAATAKLCGRGRLYQIASKPFIMGRNGGLPGQT